MKKLTISQELAKKSIIIIPARLNAIRLPNKPLALINGKTMIEHVWRRAAQVPHVRVVVAAGDQEIVDLITAKGGEAVLTAPELPSGSDRVNAALAELKNRTQYEYICNLQGDMPNVSGEIIENAIIALDALSEFEVMTAIAPMAEEETSNPNVVKTAAVKLDREGLHSQLKHEIEVYRTLYFSRATIPYNKPQVAPNNKDTGTESLRSSANKYWQHIGLYVYRRAALSRFISAPVNSLEQSERLEQLRALGLGITFGAVSALETPISVDTPEDLEKARDIMSKEEI